MSPTKRKRTNTSKKLNRWTAEEVGFLQARFARPFKAVFREYREAGYWRTERAVSVKYYGLKKAAGKTAARGDGDGRMRQAALDLAEKHDLATLQAARQIRVVLDRLT